MISSRIFERLYILGNDVRIAKLKCLTSIGIGGKAIVVEPNSVQTLIETVKFLKDEGIDHRIMGLGTNIVASDEDLKFLVLRTSHLGSVVVENEVLIAESGAPLKFVCFKALENSLSGLEELCGIPGSVGGAVKMNAGSYGKEIKDVLEWIELFDGRSLKKFSPEDLGMDYRNGKIGSRIVTRVAFRLSRKNGEEIEKTMRYFFKKRLEKQPIFEKSAGSVFKRPKPDFYVGSAIERLGLKGYRVGGVRVSQKHAGFIVNERNGTFKDFIELVNLIRKKMKEHYGVDLETEVELWGVMR